MTAPSSRGPLPGYFIRLLLAVGTVALVLTALGDAVPLDPRWLAAAVAVAGLTAAFPASPAPMAVGVAAVLALVVGDPGFSVQLVVVGSLLHTVHVLAGLAEAVPARAVVELPAVLPTVGRWARTQVTTVPVLVVLAAILA